MSMSDGALKSYLKRRKKIVDDALDGYLPPETDYPSVIFKSMRHSLFAGGKRLRPILCMAAAEAVGGNYSTVMPVACAIEMIHTYSLIHDDLPAMDDDDFRRGKPTNHRVFGEGIAILAGDALVTEAFHLMSDRTRYDGDAAEQIMSVIHAVADAAGVRGMIGGQVMDLVCEGQTVDLETLEYIHSRKTERLISVSLHAGAVLARAGEDELAALADYGMNIGYAFQIVDDILDVEGESSVMGKDTGSDEAKGKATYPALVGLAASRIRCRELIGNALAALENLDERAEPLRGIARLIIDRKA